MSDDQGDGLMPLIEAVAAGCFRAEIEKLWADAIAAFPDVKPLIELLRNDRVPMVPYARHSLANLLSPPTDPPTDAFWLELRPNKDFEKMMRRIFRVSEYNRRMAEDVKPKPKSEPTAQEVGRQFGNVQDHQVLLNKREWEQTLAKDLRDRLRGIEPKAD